MGEKLGSWGLGRSGVGGGLEAGNVWIPRNWVRVGTPQGQIEGIRHPRRQRSTDETYGAGRDVGMTDDGRPRRARRPRTGSVDSSRKFNRGEHKHDTQF